MTAPLLALPWAHHFSSCCCWQGIGQKKTDQFQEGEFASHQLIKLTVTVTVIVIMDYDRNGTLE